MHRLIIAGVLSLLLALTLIPTTTVAADEVLFAVPVRSSGYWRNQFYSVDSYFDRFIQKLSSSTPEIVTYQFNQCRRWDAAESKFTLYSAGSQPMHVMTFTAGPLTSCTMFRSEVTATERLTACQAFCTLGSCDISDCATAKTFDGFWAK